MGTAASQWSLPSGASLLKFVSNEHDQSAVSARSLEITGHHIEYDNNGKELDCEYKLR